MKPFLKQVIEYYFGKEGIENKCFIFPNRRSIVFFEKYLSETVVDNSEKSRQAGKKPSPLSVPLNCTMNDFFYLLSGKKAIERVTQLLFLYDSYVKCIPKTEIPDSLDEFIYWGDVLISDFNDVDKYLVSAEKLFTNISEFRDIDSGLDDLEPAQKNALSRLIAHFRECGNTSSKSSQKEGKTKKNFLKIWDILYPIYKDFNERLTAEGVAYEGMVYREVAERIKDTTVADLLNSKFHCIDKFIFVGLNALNECEKLVMKKMKNAGLAEFCWDFSSPMIKDPENQASKFMKDKRGTGNTDIFPQAFELDTEGLSLPDIKIISVPSAVGQANQLPQILEKIYGKNTKQTDSSDCAVVLPDETLLLPVLNSIPPEIENVNVTMGYPMSESSMFTLLKQLSSLQLHSRNMDGNKWSFYHKQVRTIFSNSVFRKALTQEGKDRMSSIIKAAKYYIPQEDFVGIPIMELIFSAVIKDQKSNSAEQIAAFEKYQLDVLSSIAENISSCPDSTMELEIAEKCYRSINLLRKKCLEILPSTYIKLVDKLLSGISVPFQGEPLKGLQIMGPLETRALDFKNLIIMSANESIFPRSSVAASFIPPEIRRGFCLPTYEFQDRVWAYYFYRMIQRASNVWMIYDSRQAGLNSGEESRYIKQLTYIYHDKFQIPITRYVAEAAATDEKEAEIVKTQEDIDIIRNKKLSATAIENYLSCPAMFYYSFVKGLSAQEDVTESMDGGMIGNIFHALMEALYTSEEAMLVENDLDDYETKKRIVPLQYIDKEYLEQKLANKKEIESKIDSLIKKNLASDEIRGRDLVTRQLINRYVINTIKKDIEFLKSTRDKRFKIVGLELRKEWKFRGFTFKGFIDRLDIVDGMLRVVDYKTGRVLDNEKNINDSNAEKIVETLFSADTKSSDRPKIAFQLFLYDKFVSEMEEASGKELNNSIYHVISLFKEEVFNCPVNSEFLKNMEEKLSSLLDEMVSLDSGFHRTSDLKVCEFCDFKDICGR